MFHCLFYSFLSIYFNLVLLFNIILVRLYFIQPNFILSYELEICVITNLNTAPNQYHTWFSFLSRKRAEIAVCVSLNLQFTSPLSNKLLMLFPPCVTCKAKNNPCTVDSYKILCRSMTFRNVDPLRNSQCKHVGFS